MNSNPQELSDTDLEDLENKRSVLLESLQLVIPNLLPRVLKIVTDNDRDQFIIDFMAQHLPADQLEKILALQIINIKLAKHKLHELQKTNKEHSAFRQKNNIKAQIEDSKFIELILDIVRHKAYKFLGINILGQKIVTPVMGSPEFLDFHNFFGNLSFADKTSFLMLIAKLKNKIATQEPQNFPALNRIFVMLSEQPEQKELLSLLDVISSAPAPNMFYLQSYNREHINHTEMGQCFEVLLTIILSSPLVPMIANVLLRISATVDSIFYGTLYTLAGIAMDTAVNALKAVRYISFGKFNPKLIDNLSVSAKQLLNTGARIDGTLALVYRLFTSNNLTVNQIHAHIQNSAPMKIAKIMPMIWLMPIMPLANASILLGNFLPASLAFLFYAPLPKIAFDPLMSLVDTTVKVALHTASVIGNGLNNNRGEMARDVLNCADDIAKAAYAVVQAPSKLITEPQKVFLPSAPTKYETETINGFLRAFATEENDLSDGETLTPQKAGYNRRRNQFAQQQIAAANATVARNYMQP